MIYAVMALQIASIAVLLFLANKVSKLMSQVSDYAAQVTAQFNDIAGDFTTIQGQIAAQNAQIASLQAAAASGTLSADDQATLAGLVTSGAALQASADALAGKVATPPPAPPAAA